MAVLHEKWIFRTGDTWSIIFACQNANGTPMSLTPDVEIIWKLDNAMKDTNIMTLLRSEGDINIINADGGLCLVKVDEDETVSVVHGLYFDELTVIKGGVFTMAEGMIGVRAKLP